MSKIKFSSCLLLLLLLTTNLFAQERNNSIGLKSGYMSYRMRDRVISNLGYNGNSTPFNIEAVFGGPVTISSLNFTIASSMLSTSTNEGFTYSGDQGDFVDDVIDGLNHSQVKSSYINYNFKHMWKLDSLSNNKFHYFLGAGISNLDFKKRFLTLHYTDLLFDKVFSFDLVGTVIYKISSKHRLQYTFTLPVINKINRTLFAQNAEQFENKYKKWGSFNNYLAFNSRLGYTYMLSRRFSLGANYDFNFLQISFPRKEQLATQSLTAALNFHF